MRSVGVALMLLAACGGRSNKHTHAGASGASAVGGAAGHASGVAGRAGNSTLAQGGSSEAGGAAPQGGALAQGGALEQGGEAGTETGGARAGAPISAGEGGGAGEGPEPADPQVLLGEYDLFLDAAPVVPGCAVDWHEARLNLLVMAGEETIDAYAFADFEWGWQRGQVPELTAGTVELPDVHNRFDALLSFSLSWGETGFLGPGTATLRYTCDDAAPTTRTVAVTVMPDTTAPKLRVEPEGPLVLGFSQFGFALSEPLPLPSGDFRATFSELEDGEQSVELYDVATNAALPDFWQWALGGPKAMLRLMDPVSIEGSTIAARLTAPLSDLAGNALFVLEQELEVLPAAVLDDEIDFDEGEPPGIYGNASYHAQAESGAQCEQGACLVLDGPATRCYEQPFSHFAVRMAETWDEDVQLRYRFWSSAPGASPIQVHLESGCVGQYSAPLSPLAEPQGVFTHASEWLTESIAPCGGPERERGFSISLGCAEYGPPPELRVVIERLTRP